MSLYISLYVQWVGTVLALLLADNYLCLLSLPVPNTLKHLHHVFHALLASLGCFDEQIVDILTANNFLAPP